MKANPSQKEDIMYNVDIPGQKKQKRVTFYLNIISFFVIIILLFVSCSSLPEKMEPVTERYDAAQKTYALGESQYDQGLYESALVNLEAALYQFGALDAREGVIKASLAMGKSALAAGEVDKALACYDRSLPLAEDLENRVLIRDTVNHLANYYLALNDLDKAKEWNRYGGEPIEKTAEVTAEYYRIDGTLAKRQGRYEEALTFYEKALDIDKALGSSQIGITYYLRGSAYSLMGDYSRAETSLNAALERDRYFELLPGIAADLTALGQVLEKAGRIDDARLSYGRAYLAWKGLENEKMTAEVAIKLANLRGELFVIP